MSLSKISKADFKLMMKNLNIEYGDIVYVEAQVSPNFFNPIYTRYLVSSLLEYIGKEGTLVLSLAGFNHDLNINEDLYDYVIPYNDRTQGLYSSSKLAEMFINVKGAKVSDSSFFPYIAIGKYADLIVNAQSFDFPNGVQSPFARLYELRAKAILVEHNIKDFLLNEHCFEISDKTYVYVDRGVVNKSVKSYLRKKYDQDIVKSLFSMKKYKELFYYTDYNDRSYLGVDIRDYVDLTLEVIEGWLEDEKNINCISGSITINGMW